jgi:hypothetical protein
MSDKESTRKQDELRDLDVREEEAADVKGGVPVSEIVITKTLDKASASLSQADPKK